MMALVPMLRMSTGDEGEGRETSLEAIAVIWARHDVT